MRAKPAAQRRSVDKRDRILKAMDTLLKRKPFSHINVADVARQARLSPATLYQRFSNEDATASVLLELYYHKVEEWARRPRKAPSRVLFDALVDIAADAFDQVAELGYVMRPAYLYSRYRPDRAGPEWKRLEQVAVGGFKAFLKRHAAEIRQNDLDEAAALVAYLYNMLLLGPLLHADDTDWKVVRRRNEFARAVATVAHRYLSASG
jgi:AcrR family transcriptional regulator